MVEYSSHDWRKNTDDAVVVDDKEETVDGSRLVRVFVNNRDDLKRSVK